MACRVGWGWNMPLLLAVLVGALSLSPLPVRSEPGRFPVRCRLDQGPWRPCVMTVEAVGERWRIELNDQRLEFRHDGRGLVEMQGPSDGWRAVNSRWSDDQALCWDGVCAQGQFPLD
jgi:hypothetical protein